MAKVNITKRYEVEFAKDGSFYKKGEKIKANMCLIAQFYKDGRITSLPTELTDDAKKLGCESLFMKGGKDKVLKDA